MINQNQDNVPHFVIQPNDHLLVVDVQFDQEQQDGLQEVIEIRINLYNIQSQEITLKSYSLIQPFMFQELNFQTINGIYREDLEQQPTLKDYLNKFTQQNHFQGPFVTLMRNEFKFLRLKEILNKYEIPKNLFHQICYIDLILKRSMSIPDPSLLSLEQIFEKHFNQIIVQSEIITAMSNVQNMIKLLKLCQNQISNLFQIQVFDYNQRLLYFCTQPPLFWNIHYGNSFQQTNYQEICQNDFSHEMTGQGHSFRNGNYHPKSQNIILKQEQSQQQHNSDIIDSEFQRQEKNKQKIKLQNESATTQNDLKNKNPGKKKLNKNSKTFDNKNYDVYVEKIKSKPYVQPSTINLENKYQRFPDHQDIQQDEPLVRIQNNVTQITNLQEINPTQKEKQEIQEIIQLKPLSVQQAMQENNDNEKLIHILEQEVCLGSSETVNTSTIDLDASIVTKPSKADKEEQIQGIQVVVEKQPLNVQPKVSISQQQIEEQKIPLFLPPVVINQITPGCEQFEKLPLVRTVFRLRNRLNQSLTQIRSGSLNQIKQKVSKNKYKPNDKTIFELKLDEDQIDEQEIKYIRSQSHNKIQPQQQLKQIQQQSAPQVIPQKSIIHQENEWNEGIDQKFRTQKYPPRYGKSSQNQYQQSRQNYN